MFDGEGGLKLHPDDGFTGYSTPDLTLSAERGELNVRLDSFFNFVNHFWRTFWLCPLTYLLNRYISSREIESLQQTLI